MLFKNKTYFTYLTFNNLDNYYNYSEQQNLFYQNSLYKYKGPDPEYEEQYTGNLILHMPFTDETNLFKDYSKESKLKDLENSGKKNYIYKNNSSTDVNESLFTIKQIPNTNIKCIYGNNETTETTNTINSVVSYTDVIPNSDDENTAEKCKEILLNNMLLTRIGPISQLTIEFWVYIDNQNSAEFSFKSIVSDSGNIAALDNDIPLISNETEKEKGFIEFNFISKQWDEEKYNAEIELTMNEYQAKWSNNTIFTGYTSKDYYTIVSASDPKSTTLFSLSSNPPFNSPYPKVISKYGGFTHYCLCLNKDKTNDQTISLYINGIRCLNNKVANSSLTEPYFYYLSPELYINGYLYDLKIYSTALYTGEYLHDKIGDSEEISLPSYFFIQKEKTDSGGDKYILTDTSIVLEDREDNKYNFMYNDNKLTDINEIKKCFSLKEPSVNLNKNNKQSLTILKDGAYIKTSDPTFLGNYYQEFTLSFYYKLSKNILFNDKFFNPNDIKVIHGISWNNNLNRILLFDNAKVSKLTEFYKNKCISINYKENKDDNEYKKYCILFDYESYDDKNWIHFIMTFSEYGRIKVYINEALYLNVLLPVSSNSGLVSQFNNFENLIIGNYGNMSGLFDPNKPDDPDLVIQYDEFSISNFCLYDDLHDDYDNSSIDSTNLPLNNTFPEINEDIVHNDDVSKGIIKFNTIQKSSPKYYNPYKYE